MEKELQKILREYKEDYNTRWDQLMDDLEEALEIKL